MSDNDYICTKPTKASAEELLFVANTIGFSDIIPAEEIHCSLIYGETGSNSEEMSSIINPNATYMARMGDLGILGEGDNRAVVVFLNSPQLVERNSQLRLVIPDRYGDGFIPHISIKYGVTEEDERLVNAYSKVVSMVMQPIVLTGEFLCVEGDDVQS